MESTVLEIRTSVCGWEGIYDLDLCLLPSKIRLKSGEILWIDPVPRVGKQSELADLYGESL